MRPVDRAKRDAEMQRGTQVIVEKHGAMPLLDVLASNFDPEYQGAQPDPNWKGDEGARPSPENKAYRDRMQKQVQR